MVPGVVVRSAIRSANARTSAGTALLSETAMRMMPTAMAQPYCSMLYLSRSRRPRHAGGPRCAPSCWPTLSATRSLRTTLDAARRRWPGDAAPFYDALAEYYDLIFEDWDASMA